MWQNTRDISIEGNTAIISSSRLISNKDRRGTRVNRKGDTTQKYCGVRNTVTYYNYLLAIMFKNALP